VQDNKNSQILGYIFLNPPEKRHDTNLLNGVKLPEKMMTLNTYE